jgi:hypothetical protein
MNLCLHDLLVSIIAENGWRFNGVLLKPFQCKMKNEKCKNPCHTCDPWLKVCVLLRVQSALGSLVAVPEAGVPSYFAHRKPVCCIPVSGEFFIR